MDKFLRDYMKNEFEIAVEHMRSESSIHEVLYFMSAAYGAISRVQNIEYDRRLAFSHSVLNAAHGTISQAVNQGPGQRERSIRLFAEVIDTLADRVEDLGRALHAGESTYEILEAIAEIAFAFTGNGNYLHSKGTLKIPASRQATERFESILSDKVEPL